MSTQQLHREQTDQADTRNYKRLAQCRLSKANALQAYAGDDDECRRLIIDFVGNARAKILRHLYDIGMRSVGYDPVSDLETFHSGTDLGNDAYIAVTQGQGLPKLRTNSLDSSHQAICSGQPIPDSGLSFSSATAGGNPSLN